MGCCIEGCTRRVVARGLCHSHYQSARNWVLDAKGTWGDLIVAGCARLCKHPSQPRFTDTAPAPDVPAPPPTPDASPQIPSAIHDTEVQSVPPWENPLDEEEGAE